MFVDEKNLTSSAAKMCENGVSELSKLLSSTSCTSHELQYETQSSPSAESSGIRTYRKRWYMLAIFSALTFVQSAVWNTFGPIAESALAAFPSWNTATIALLGNWGTITYVLFAFPLCWLAENKGLRISILFTAGIMVVATGIRCVTCEEFFFTIIAHMSAICNGLAGIILFSAPSMLSALWFPPQERTTGTGVSTVFNHLGNAGGFLLGPLIVKQPDINSTLSDSQNQQELRKAITQLMYIEAAVCVFLCVCVLCDFSDRPPLPPSMTSSIPRMNVWDGCKHLIRDQDVWLLSLAFSISQGILGAWWGVLDIDLSTLGMDQVSSSWLGTWSIFASCIFALAIAHLTDVFAWRRHMKRTIVLLLLAATICFTYLALMCLDIVPNSVTSVYVCTVLGSSCNYAASPLFFELTAEVAYPVPEGLVGGFMTVLFNLMAAMFLFLFFVPSIGVTWMNYCLAIAPALSLPFLVFAQEHYRRSSLDFDNNVKKSAM